VPHQAVLLALNLLDMSIILGYDIVLTHVYREAVALLNQLGETLGLDVRRLFPTIVLFHWNVSY
jgi:hypothetical protein